MEIFNRLWNAIKPPPPVRRPDPRTPEQRRRQRKLVSLTIGAVLLFGAGYSAYSYIASAEERANRQFLEGMRLMAPKTYPTAIADFDRAIGIWPQFAEAYLERGVAHQSLGQIDSALADFNKALDLNPGLARAHTARGAIYRSRGDIKGAMEEFTKAIQTEPIMEAFYERGQTYESAGEHQKAIDDYDQAIALLRDAPYVYRARALAKRNLGDIGGYEADRDKADLAEHRR
jgi:tetratricopeptide (TPR) repeat protein